MADFIVPLRSTRRRGTRIGHRPTRVLAAAVAGLLIAVLLATPARASTVTWTGGGSDSLWSNPANWAGGVPVDGDSLVFPANASRRAAVNDLVGLVVASMTIDAPSAGGYDLSGNAFTLVGGLSADGTTADTVNRIGNDVTLGAAQTWTVGFELRLDGTLGGGAGAVLTKDGVGQLSLDAANSYAGTTTVAAGVLRAEEPDALGTGAGALDVRAGGQLVVHSAGGAVLARPVQIAGEGVGAWPGVGALSLDGAVVSGDVTVSPNFVTAIAGAGSLTGRLVGTGELVLSSNGTTPLIVGGTTSNTFSGAIEVATFTGPGVVLEKTSGAVAVPGPGRLTVGNGRLVLGGPDQITPGTPLLVQGTFDLGGYAASVGAAEFSSGAQPGDVAGPGTLVVDGDITGSSGARVHSTLDLGTRDHTVTVAQGGVTPALEIDGPLIGTGRLTKVGDGALRLAGSGTFSGVTRIEQGTLIVDGSLPQSPITLQGGTLSGSGTIGPLVADAGSIEPGRPLTVAGDARLAAAAALDVTLDPEHERPSVPALRVDGVTSLQRSRLAIGVLAQPEPGTRFTIVETVGTEAVEGMFAGLPEGATVAAGDVRFTLTYRGGDGNDVVLTAMAPPAAGSRLASTGSGASLLGAGVVCATLGVALVLASRSRCRWRYTTGGAVERGNVTVHT